MEAYNDSAEYYVVVAKDRRSVLHKNESIYGKSVVMKQTRNNIAHCISCNAIRFEDKATAERAMAYYCEGKKKVTLDDLEVLLVKTKTSVEIG